MVAGQTATAKSRPCVTVFMTVSAGPLVSQIFGAACLADKAFLVAMFLGFDSGRRSPQVPEVASKDKHPVTARQAVVGVLIL